MKKKICASFMTLGMAFLVNTANATPVSGDISFSGIADKNDTEITAIKFPEEIVVAVKGGDFRDANEFTGSFTIPTATDAPWSLDDLSFDLANITENNLIVDDGEFSQGFNRVKSIKGNIANTLYSWTYPTDSTKNTTDFEQRFFASEVPAPAGIALLSFALIGLIATRGNKK